MTAETIIQSLASGLLMTKPPQGKVIYFYAVAAFLAGFSERFTGVMFGGAERLLTGDDDPEHASSSEPAGSAGTTTPETKSAASTPSRASGPG